MNMEQVIKAGLDGQIAELRFFYEHTGQELERFDALRTVMYRQWVEQNSDPEFASFCAKRNNIFGRALADAEAVRRGVKLMTSDEMVAAMKEATRKVEGA